MKSGWKTIEIGNIAPAKSNGMPDENAKVWNLSLDEVESVTGRLLKKTHCRVSELGSAKCSFDTRHVLYSKLRPYLNKVVLPDEPGVGTSELIPMLPDPKRLDREFLAFYLRSPIFIDFAKANTRGANLPRIAMKELWKHKFPMPDNVTEQRRIVARIKECMERVEEIEGLRLEAREETENIFRSHCAEIFLADWPENTVKDLITEKPSNGIFKRRKDFGEGVLLANVKDLYGDQVIHPERLDRVRASNKEIIKYCLNPGDVLVNRSSLKREGTGRSCVFEGCSEPVVFECHIMKVTLRKDKLHPYLFAAFMNCQIGLQRILMRAKTATMTTWNQTDLQSIMVPTPPIKLQENFVEELKTIKGRADELRAGLSNGELKFMRDSILRKAFAGEL